jgi:putative transposase
MPRRFDPFVQGCFYHVFNRGVNKQPIFLTEQDYLQAQLGLSYYRFTDPKLRLSRYKRLTQLEKTKLELLNAVGGVHIQILAYALMPNHFHLLVKQETNDGVSVFVRKFSNSYARYFNTKHSRVGPLFQGLFKAVSIDSEEQLIHVSRYIHLNPFVADLVSKETLAEYKWSSFKDYATKASSFVSPQEILSLFKSKTEYFDFVLNHADYAEALERIKHQTLDL